MKLKRAAKCVHGKSLNGHCQTCQDNTFNRNGPPDDPAPPNGPKVTSVFNTRSRQWETPGGGPIPRKDVEPRKRKHLFMPFGTYRGQYLEDLPTDYLEYVIAETEDLGNGLHESIELVLNNRLGGPERELLEDPYTDRFDLG
jgi:uncharacterized protein (DUF3820 family)